MVGKPAGAGVNNLASRRAVCEKHKYGSVRAGEGNLPGYSTALG